MFTVANAQYSPEKGDIAVELGFTPFKAGGETFQLNEGMVKARWFFSDKNALRLKLGLGIDNKKTSLEESFNPIVYKNETVYKREGNSKDKSTQFSIMLGYERHLFTKGRFDVYAGLELGYIMDKVSGSETYKSSSTSYDGNNTITSTTSSERELDYKNRSVDGTKHSMNSFNANLFAGVDFYVWKNLYLGAELGLNFKTGKSPNSYLSGNEYTQTTNYINVPPYTTYYTQNTTRRTFDEDMIKTTTTTSSTVPGSGPWDPTYSYSPQSINETSETSFKLFVEPAVRIGWKF